MEVSSPILVSSKLPSSFICFNFAQKNNFSFRHFNKQLVCNSQRKLEIPKSLTISFNNVNSSLLRPYNIDGFQSIQCLQSKKNTFSFTPFHKQLVCKSQRNLEIPNIQCSYSNAAETDGLKNVLESLKGLSLESLKMGFSQLTLFKVLKWCLVFSVVIGVSKWMMNVLANPFFWMYFSMTWLYWPWLVAISLASYSLYCLNKDLRGEANVFEQFGIVTSVFTWLTLVPPAHFNGFLEGWPVCFFLVYHYFFFLNVSIRKRMYGDYKPREHDPKWDISLPSWQKLLFCVGVMVGHWFAAFEGPELHLIPGGWNNLGVWVLIVMALFMQYHSSLYLAKYSEKVVVPTAVVQFGPYRFVRHPIYASTMLLFVAYCVALKAPLSALFIAVVCSVYYGNKAKLEESMMVENFGEIYMEYASKVKYRLIPYVY